MDKFKSFIFYWILPIDGWKCLWQRGDYLVLVLPLIWLILVPVHWLFIIPALLQFIMMGSLFVPLYRDRNDNK